MIYFKYFDIKQDFLKRIMGAWISTIFQEECPIIKKIRARANKSVMYFS